MLRTIRPIESLTALKRLGCRAPRVTRLGLPDGRVAEFEEQLCEELAARGHEDDVWLAPWCNDGHPDHDACGRAASTLASPCKVRLLSYLVWAWHWADPSGEELPWEHCRRHDFDAVSASRKRWSIDAFSSQIQTSGASRHVAPVLPPEVLERFNRNFEVFVEGAMTQWGR